MRETTITIPFEITGWDEDVYEEPAEGPRLTQALVRKRYRGGLEATSVARLLTAQGEGGRGYLASERVEGTLQGRRGTFVLQHGAVDGDGELAPVRVRRRRLRHRRAGRAARHRPLRPRRGRGARDLHVRPVNRPRRAARGIDSRVVRS
ncbi:MAG: DUF3224 domain-containing protein [Solirubrobacteraceae bacterium]|nr:DUF3224 domain-containing protein [Solirubrobacteraceae bacterium]